MRRRNTDLSDNSERGNSDDDDTGDEADPLLETRSDNRALTSDDRDRNKLLLRTAHSSHGPSKAAMLASHPVRPMHKRSNSVTNLHAFPSGRLRSRGRSPSYEFLGDPEISNELKARLSTAGSESGDDVSTKTVGNVEDNDDRIPYDEHLMSLSELADAYRTHIDLEDARKSGGLKPNHAETLLSTGKNALTPPPRTPGWIIFLMQFTNLFMILLLTAALLSIVIYCLYGENSDLYLGVILVIVVLATCYETYHQEEKSEDFLASLKTLMPDITMVVRGGEWQSVNVETLVMGDVVKLRYGDKVPADCRIIYSQVIVGFKDCVS